jgi:hypothetical protein
MSGKTCISAIASKVLNWLQAFVFNPFEASDGARMLRRYHEQQIRAGGPSYTS